MAESNLSGRLVEIELMLDRSRRRFEEGARLVEEAQKLLADIQQAMIGSPRSVSPEDSEEAASKLLASPQGGGRRHARNPVRRPAGGRPDPAPDPNRRPSDRHHRDGISGARAARLRAQQCRHPGDAVEAPLSPLRRPAAAQDHRRVHLQAPQEAPECVAAGPSSSRPSRSAAGSFATSTPRAAPTSSPDFVEVAIQIHRV